MKGPSKFTKKDRKHQKCSKYVCGHVVSPWDLRPCLRCINEIIPRNSRLILTLIKICILTFVLQQSNRNNPSRRGPDECAQLIRQSDEVFLASGVNQTINIAVQNLPDRFTDVEVNFEIIPKRSPRITFKCVLKQNGIVNQIVFSVLSQNNNKY